MRRPRFKKREWVRGAATYSKQTYRNTWAHQTRTSPYHRALLLVWLWPQIHVSPIQKNSWQDILTLKTLPHTLANGLRQPEFQYRIALLLATLFAVLIGWTLFFSTLPHAATIAFTEPL